MAQRVALVTGASRGIGRATALALASAGFDVAVAARTAREGACPDVDWHGAPRAGSLATTAGAVRTLGRRALEVPLDLCERASAERAVARVLAEWGRLDVLVNNAVHVEPAATQRVLDLDIAGYERLLVANVVTQTRLAQLAAAAMVEREGGAIVNVVSVAGRVDPPAPTDRGGWGFGYASHKAALLRLAGILHVELAERGVLAFGVEPGGVLTDALRAAYGPEGLAEAARLYGLVTPEAIASVIAWLVTAPEARALSGQTVDAPLLCRERRLLPEGQMLARV
jgi:hypothetical protein